MAYCPARPQEPVYTKLVFLDSTSETYEYIQVTKIPEGTTHLKVQLDYYGNSGDCDASLQFYKLVELSDEEKTILDNRFKREMKKYEKELAKYEEYKKEQLAKQEKVKASEEAFKASAEYKKYLKLKKKYC